MTVERLVGVYDADGGLAGELRYVAGTLAGRHCSLCDITHGRVRAKPAWQACRRAFPVPLEAVHRNEREPDLAAATDGHLPCVAGREDGRWRVVLDRDALDACHGDVGAFEAALRRALGLDA